MGLSVRDLVFPGTFPLLISLRNLFVLLSVVLAGGLSGIFTRTFL